MDSNPHRLTKSLLTQPLPAGGCCPFYEWSIFFGLMIYLLFGSLVCFFDEQLNFNFHLKILSSKLSKARYILRSSKKFLTQSLVFPIWSCASQSSIKKHQNYAKKLYIRIVHKTLNHCLKELKILPLDSWIKFFNLQFIQHYIQCFLPVSFNGFWLTNEERRPEDMQQHTLTVFG